MFPTRIANFNMAQVIILMLLSSVAWCQTIENGWRGIRPLQSNREKVERMLKLQQVISGAYYNYEDSDVFLQITYTTEPCVEEMLGRGIYNVPKDTVLRYYLRLKKTIKLSDFKFQKEHYTKAPSGDVHNLVEYRNLNKGIILTAYLQDDGTEYVDSLRIEPAKEQENALKCRRSKARVPTKSTRRKALSAE